MFIQRILFCMQSLFAAFGFYLMWKQWSWPENDGEVNHRCNLEFFQELNGIKELPTGAITTFKRPTHKES